MDTQSISATDKLSARLRSVARTLLILGGGLMPLLFIPSAYIPFSGGKTIIVAVLTALAVLFLVLSILREGRVALRLPLPLLGLWAVVAVAFVSAALSGDVRDAVFGQMIDSYSAGFLLLLAIIATAAFVFVESKQSVIRLYSVLIFSSIVLTIFHVARLFLGSEALSFGFFASGTASPVGSWNGLAIFYSLVILISLIALQQLPMSRAGRWIAIGVVALSLGMLAVVNFSAAWWVLALVSGVITLHQLAYNVWRQDGRQAKENDSFDLVMVSILILVTSIIFLVGGATLSNAISNRLGVSFVEVRPAAAATIDLTKAALTDNFLLGSGPNRFSDVWRVHKDPSINQTIFWNVPFDSGYSYLLTSFINNGILGIATWALFFFGLAWAGVRFLFKVSSSDRLDRFWYFIGLSSLVATVYFWLMAALYVPPPGILLLTALTTGVFIAAYSRAVPGMSWQISAIDYRSHGLVLIVAAVTTISVTGYAIYMGGKEALSVYQFNKVMATVAEGDSLETVNDRIAGVFQTADNDMFARQIAFHHWSRLRAILGVTDPSETDRKAFEDSAARGIETAQLAINLDPTDPVNHQLLGQIYAILAVVGVEGAADKAAEALTTAKRLDPKNPTIYLIESDLALQRKDSGAARAAAEEAVRLKPNYTEALFLLAQLDINEGKVDSAISIVAGIAQLEPQNPARRYQLGVLLASATRLDEAVEAFKQAIALDPQYANAHYYLGLTYAEQGKTEEAIKELTVVRDLSETNSAVEDLITQLRETGRIATSTPETSTVSDRDPALGEVTEEDLESDLVTSSNPVPGGETETENEQQ